MSKKRISFSTKPNLPPNPDQWVTHHSENIINQPITSPTNIKTDEKTEIINEPYNKPYEIIEALDTVIEDSQEKRLSDLETIIQDNLEGFYKVGTALKEIRDSKLYKEVLGYNRFEDYCADRWDMSKTYALRLESAAKIVDHLKSGLETQEKNTMVLPKTESQVRPLHALNVEEQLDIWLKVIDAAPIEEKTGEPKITAKLVQETIYKNTPHIKSEIPKVAPKKIPLSDEIENHLGNILYKLAKEYNTQVKQQEMIFACIELVNEELNSQNSQSPMIQALLHKLNIK